MTDRREPIEALERMEKRVMAKLDRLPRYGHYIAAFVAIMLAGVLLSAVAAYFIMRGVP